jgi:hypothetical protein
MPPPVVPPPPPYAPDVALPSARPLGQAPAVFARRVATGRWEWAALVPALAVAALALLIGAWSGVAVHYPGLGARTRLVLALLVQGLGGSLRVSQSYDLTGFGGSFDGTDSGFSGGGAYPPPRTVDASYSVMPLTVTLLWIGLLLLVLFRVRRRQTGPEAAVRVALVAAAGALVLALVAQPTIQSTSISSGPVPVTLWALVISLVTASAVLCRAEARAWSAARPGFAAVLRAVGTAALALLLCVAVAGVAVFVIAAAHYRALSGWGVGFAALMVLNLGVSGLSLGWGGPFVLTDRPQPGQGIGVSFGLSDLGQVWGGWAVAGAVAGGLLCALLIGFLTVRRSRDRTEQFVVAGVFSALFLLLAAVGAVSAHGDAGAVTLVGGTGNSSAGSRLPQALLFGLLWSVGGVFVAPYVWRVLGGKGMPAGAFERRWARGAGHVPPSPLPTGPTGLTGDVSAYVPPQAPPHAPPPHAPPPHAPPAPPYAPPPPPAEPVVHDLGIVQPPRLNKPNEPGRPPKYR